MSGFVVLLWCFLGFLFGLVPLFPLARLISEEIPCRDVHLARCLQFAMHKFRLSLFVKDLEPGGSTTFCFLIV